MYLNPTRGRVAVISESRISRVLFYGSTGILQKEVEFNDSSINLENLAAGLYLLKVEFVNFEINDFPLAYSSQYSTAKSLKMRKL
jgi:hypothetical protein